MSFVGRMVEESCEMGVRQRCLWFTSMLGKHASVAKIVGLLKDKNVCRLLFFFVETGLF